MTTETLAIDGGTPVRTKPFGSKHFFGEEDLRQVTEVVQNAMVRWNSGEKVQAFEDKFAQKHDIKYAISTDSGSGALHSAVAALDLDPGDEIITTPVTDIGTVQGILLQNLIPVFADWDADTFNTDPADIERRITDRTGAILVVHLFGNPCDMDEVLDIGRRHNLPVIEDCAQAHLAEYKGQLVGTMGDVGCYSLGGKMMTTGQGGMIITNNEPLARRAKGHAHKGSEYDDELQGVAQADERASRLGARLFVPGRLPHDERSAGGHRAGPDPEVAVVQGAQGKDGGDPGRGDVRASRASGTSSCAKGTSARTGSTGSR